MDPVLGVIRAGSGPSLCRSDSTRVGVRGRFKRQSKLQGSKEISKSRAYTISLQKRLKSFAWKQPEDLQVWRCRARLAYGRVAAVPKATEVPLDISTEGVRLPTSTEVIEEMIRVRLSAEGFCTSGDDEDSTMQKSISAFKPQNGDSDSEEKGTELEPPEHRKARAKLSASELDELAPIKKYAQIKKERLAKIATETGNLLHRETAEYMKSKVANATSSSFSLYDTAIHIYPHKGATERVAMQHGFTRNRMAHKDDDFSLPDVSDIPESVLRVKPDDVIVTVAVCNKKGAKDQEFDILASQCLFELRDALHFASDWMFDGPTRMKSACFFINGVFYADKRHPDALDYSKELIPWLKETRGARFVKSDESKSMDTRICDLTPLPFGEVCVYVHQGDIEHHVVFTNARLINKQSDCPFVEAYPLLTFMRAFRKRRCYACFQNCAIWIVLDSSRCAPNPSFWCQNCFNHFYRDEAGRYVPPVDYKIFPYLHDDA